MLVAGGEKFGCAAPLLIDESQDLIASLGGVFNLVREFNRAGIRAENQQVAQVGGRACGLQRATREAARA